MSIRDVAKEVHLDWHTGEEIGAAVHGGAAPTYWPSRSEGHRDRRNCSEEGAYLPDRRQRSGATAPLWFGGQDRSETILDAFYEWVGPKKRAGIRLAVMNMWKAFENIDAEERATGGNPVRQVPCDETSGNGIGSGSEAGIWSARREEPFLHQGTEVHVAIEP